MGAMGHGTPLARDKGLLCREMPDGLMVYDLDRHEAHSLNRTAALVWRHCDGKMGVSDLAVLLQQKANLPAEEAVVWLALESLDKAHLLQDRLTRPAETPGMSRRAVIRKIGLAGGLVALLPLVDSLTAPPAYAQASGEGGGTGGCTAADCSPCPTAGNAGKICCSGPSGVPVCVSPNSANCKKSPSICA
jgi:hypothetical protein